jgi:molybdate/tungstate transport system substrate-binding protein
MNSDTQAHEGNREHRDIPDLRVLRFLCVLVCSVVTAAGPLPAQAPTGPLVVFNAGSLAQPFRELLRAFRTRHPDVVPAQENSGSVEAARKLTELGKIPDVLGVADYNVIPALLVPKHASWYVTFARNAMVLAYAPGSRGAKEINGQNWWRVLLQPGVHTGRSDPALDPNGYRVLMVTRLAERHYREPGLAARLLAAMPNRFMRPKEADLTALLEAGELDYIWTYRSIAETNRLSYVTLPREVDLSDPALGNAYGAVSVRVPGSKRTARDSVEFRGEPILYALTIPEAAPHPATAAAFARFVLSSEGSAILRRSGFLIAPPRAGGPGKPPPGLF